jgi:hypothetical protein
MINYVCDENFMLYAAKHYSNPQCLDIAEFNEDVNRVKYIKRLINRYKLFGEIKERLVLNHIIILCNVFGPEPAVKMLFYKLNGLYHYLIPFLQVTGHLPKQVIGVGSPTTIINTNAIEPDQKLLRILKQI